MNQSMKEGFGYLLVFLTGAIVCFLTQKMMNNVRGTEEVKSSYKYVSLPEIDDYSKDSSDASYLLGFTRNDTLFIKHDMDYDEAE